MPLLRNTEERNLWDLLRIPSISHSLCFSIIGHQQPNWTNGLFRDSDYVCGRGRRQKEPREFSSALLSHPKAHTRVCTLPRVTQASDRGQEVADSTTPLLPGFYQGPLTPTFLTRPVHSDKGSVSMHFASEITETSNLVVVCLAPSQP